MPRRAGLCSEPHCAPCPSTTPQAAPPVGRKLHGRDRVLAARGQRHVMRSRWVGCTRAANKDQRAKRERQGNRNAHSARAGSENSRGAGNSSRSSASCQQRGLPLARRHALTCLHAAQQAGNEDSYEPLHSEANCPDLRHILKVAGPTAQVPAPGAKPLPCCSGTYRRGLRCRAAPPFKALGAAASGLTPRS